MTQRDENQAAYRRLQADIDQRYPQGTFVAIDGGKIVADALSFEELDGLLAAKRLNAREVLVGEVGAVYPEFVNIFM